MEILEPNVYGYLRYCASSLVRYFVVGGAFYCVFHVWFRQRWFRYRIQQEWPPQRDVLHGIGWTLSSTACTGVSTILMYGLVRDGHTPMYFAVDEYGWIYFVLSVLLFVLGVDAYTYWEHRLLHLPWAYRHIHRIHHQVSNPTPFATFAQHPVETFVTNAFFVLFVVFVPIHPLALAAGNLFLVGHGLLAHSGYELYPARFTRHPLFQWMNTSTHHNMHHHLVGCNYSHWFNHWDRFAGTNHPSYHDTFDACTARRTREWPGASTALEPNPPRSAAELRVL